MKWRKKEVKFNINVVFVMKRQEVMEFLAIYDVLSLMNVNLPQMMMQCQGWTDLSSMEIKI